LPEKQHYITFMKNLKIFTSLLAAILLLGSSALPQTSDSQNSRGQDNSIAAARCRYTPADDACAGLSDHSRARRGADDDTTLAQIPRPVPGRPHMLMKAGPMPEPSLRHAAIGGLIGFVLGVTHPSDNTVRGHLALGMLVGLIGAGLGAGIPSHPHYANPRGRWPEDDEEATHSKPHKSKVALSKPDSPRVTSPSPSSTHTEDPLPAAEAP
jgi:hypothetical protein